MNDKTSRSKNQSLKIDDSDDENDGLNYGPEKENDEDDWDNQYHFIKLFRVFIEFLIKTTIILIIIIIIIYI